jgi:uncharacterized protein involved in exopolysaccharide biosynthesis
VEQAMGGGVRRPTTGRTEDEMLLSAMYTRIRSRPFLERVIRILRMEEDPTVLDQARSRLDQHPELTLDEMAVRLLVQGLRSRIHVQSGGTGVYKIIAADFTPENAQLLARWISELFVDVTIKSDLEQIRIAREFGAEQLRVYEEQLQRSEEALEQFQGSMIEQGLAQNRVRESNYSLAEAMARRAERETSAAQDRAWSFLRAIASTGLSAEPLRGDPEVETLARRITSEVQRAIFDVLASTTADPDAWSSQSGISVLRRNLYDGLDAKADQLYPDAPPADRDKVVRCVFAQIEADVQGHAASLLNGAIQAFKRQAQSAPERDLELARLQSEVAKNQQLLASFRAQMVASDIVQAVETNNLGSQIEIIDPAQLPLSASRPNRLKILLASLLMGPLLGVGFAFIAEVMDSTLRTAGDIQRVVPEPILGMTPLLSRRLPRRRGVRRRLIPALTAGVLLLTAAFFITRNTVFKDVALTEKPVNLVNPEEVATP